EPARRAKVSCLDSMTAVYPRQFRSVTALLNSRRDTQGDTGGPELPGPLVRRVEMVTAAGFRLWAFGFGLSAFGFRLSAARFCGCPKAKSQEPKAALQAIGGRRSVRGERGLAP